MFIYVYAVFVADYSPASLESDISTWYSHVVTITLNAKKQLQVI